MTSLAGTFHVGQRESRLMAGLRLKGLPVNAIAKTLGRSTSTIDAWVPGGLFDNRRQSPVSRSKGRISWMSQLKIMRLKCALFLKGIINSVNEALDCRSVPIPAIEYLNETSSGEDVEDPA